MAIKHKVAGALALTALISSATLIAPTQASAESYPVTPTGITAIDTASTGYTLGVNYNQSAYYGTWMTQLKNVRAAAWDANLPFKDYNGATTVREAAAAAGLTTRDAYINAFTFDAGLEVEALIRASEVMLNPSHTRPAGLPDTIIGSGTRGENLTRNIPLDKAVGAWSTDATYGNELVNGKRISEWDSLLRSGGEWNYYNGHLYAILNPQFNTVAMGAVTNVNQATPAVVMRLAEAPTGYGTAPTNATGAYRVPININNPGGLLHQVRLIGSSTLNISDTRELRLGTTHITGAVQFFDVKPIGSWVSSNPAVIAVDEDGTLTGVGAGTATISYVTEAGATYSSQALTVAAPTPIKPVQPEPTAEPTTEPVVPEPTVEPTAAPSTEPTAIPTVEPTIEPVEPEPTVAPTEAPVDPVVPEPTEAPVDPVPSTPAEPEPTASAEPTDAPVDPVAPEPTEEPVAPAPTDAPVDPEPTAEPEPTVAPTVDPVDPAPSTPAEPSEPAEPVIPDTEEPIQPSEPEVPAPAEPATPEAPATKPAAPLAPSQAPADADAAPAAPEATEAATQPSASTTPEATAKATNQKQGNSQDAQKQTAPASENQLAHTGLTSTALLWIGLALMATGALAIIRPWRAARRS